LFNNSENLLSTPSRKGHSQHSYCQRERFIEGEQIIPGSMNNANGSLFQVKGLLLSPNQKLNDKGHTSKTTNKVQPDKKLEAFL